MSMANVKTFSEIFSIWFAIAAACLGGGYSLLEYWDNKRADRVAMSIDYVNRYTFLEMSDERDKISAPFIEDSENLTRLPQVEQTREIKRIYNEQVLSIPLVKVIDFYDMMRVCACERLCDTGTLGAFFGQEAFSTFSIYAPIIEEIKGDYGPDFGEALKDFARVGVSQTNGGRSTPIALKCHPPQSTSAL